MDLIKIFLVPNYGYLTYKNKRRRQKIVKKFFLLDIENLKSLFKKKKMLKIQFYYIARYTFKF